MNRKFIFLLKFFPVSLIFLAPIALAAEVSNSQDITTVTQNTQERSTIVGTAKDWGLSDTEWAQYQELMRGVYGHWYPQLTPPAVLGLHTATVEEEKHFAEIVATQEHDKVAREIAFNNAVFLAMRRLYPNELIIADFDKTPFNPQKKLK